MESENLLSRACAGERAARDELFTRHALKLRMFVERRLGRALARRVEPDDVVQETFLRAMKELNGARFAGESAFFGFLTTLARHVIVDLARAARVRKIVAPGAQLPHSDWSVSPLDLAQAKTSGPVTKAARNERAEMLLVAWRALPPQYQRVISLRQFEGRPARDCAQPLGTTEMGVHALFRRALDAWGTAVERAGGSRPA